MGRFVVCFMLLAAAGGPVRTVEADFPFFNRGDRSQRSESRRARSERPEAGQFLRVPPAPLDDAVRPAVPDQLPPVPPLPVIPEQFAAIPDAMGALPSGPIELFRRVEYDDREDSHPRGVKRLVAVRDPRSCRKPCDCCEPGLVFVEVCVPPHGCPKVKHSKDLRKIELDYGEYEIEIASEDGEVEVEYED